MRAWVVLACLTACGDDDGARPFQDAAPGDGRADAPLDTPPDGGGTLTTETMFAGGIGALCGLAYDHTDNTVWVFPCPGTDVHHFSAAGVALGTVPRSGEATDDMDLHVAPAAFTLGTTPVAAGGLLFINGENGPAEIYAPASVATPSLATAYGESHVVGGAYHVARASLFLVQDRNGATGPNQVAEIDIATGAVRSTFSTLPDVVVNYGDLEVCQRTGNLFVVSSVETTLAELTPTGTLVAEYPLPEGFPLASGLGLDETTGAAWVSATNGSVIRMSGVNCGP